MSSWGSWSAVGPTRSLLDPPAARRARCARRAQLPLEPGRERRLLPHGHDLRGNPAPCGTTGRSTREWVPLVNSVCYDPRPVHAKLKAGATVGMAMTEKQGGSDLRATITTARPAASRRGPGAPYLITGHKWFFSVPMSDLFFTLAQAEGGLSCFLAAGWLPDGTRNGLRLQRLKEVRQPVERQLRGGVRSPARGHVGRGGARHPHDHRDGARDPA